MNYAKIEEVDVANFIGVRVSIFFCGCTHHCKNCFNSEIWEFSSGKLFDNEAKKELFKHLSKPYIRGLSVLGGEPLQQGQEMVELLYEVKNTFPDKDICLWTGYYIDGSEELDEIQKKIISLCDYVIDGRFDNNKRDITLRFRGSTNQTIWEKRDNKWVKSELNN